MWRGWSDCNSAQAVDSSSTNATLAELQQPAFPLQPSSRPHTVATLLGLWSCVGKGEIRYSYSVPARDYGRNSYSRVHLSLERQLKIPNRQPLLAHLQTMSRNATLHIYLTLLAPTTGGAGQRIAAVGSASRWALAAVSWPFRTWSRKGK